MDFVVTLKTGAFSCLLCIFLFATGGCRQPFKEIDTYVDHPVGLRVARSGVSIIETVTTVHNVSDAPPECSLRCVSATGALPIKSLSDLKGLVQIISPSDALYFVRFRTSLYTFDAFPDNSTVEIENAEEREEMSNYGTPPDVGIGGETGVLDDEQFKQMRFSEASVKTVAGQFVITRWLLVYDFASGSEYVEKVRETVGRDGDYNIAVLKRKDISAYTQGQSPDSWWWFRIFDYQ